MAGFLLAAAVLGAVPGDGGGPDADDAGDALDEILGGHNKPRPSTGDMHAEGDRKRARQQTGKKDRAAEAAKRKRQGKAAFEASKPPEKVLEEVFEKTADEIRDDLNKVNAKLNRLKSKNSKLYQELLDKRKELERGLNEIDSLKKMPFDKLKDLLPTLRKANNPTVKRLAGQALKAVGRTVVVGGFIVGAIQWKARAAEAGAVRATVEATPVLGDIVILHDQYREIQKALAETEAAYSQIEQILRDGDASRQSWCRRHTVNTYYEIANQIDITRPEYIDLNAIGNAVRLFNDKLNSVMVLLGNGDITVQQARQRLKQLEAELRQNLIDAANQPGSDRPKPTGPLA